jgi:hypothetical protein
MTGFSPIASFPSPALDIVKPDGLIPLAKKTYLQRRAGGFDRETFSLGARSIFRRLGRLRARERRVGMQKGVWIG